ncbi:MAG: VWA domain-containing protein [Pseudomonadota bacterium]
MSDYIEKLRAALGEVLPDPKRKAETLAGAMAAFDAHQGSGTSTRLNPTRRPLGWILDGVRTMTDILTSRGGLAATTALAALALIVISPVGRDLRNPPASLEVTEAELSPTRPEPGSGDLVAASPVAPRDRPGASSTAQTRRLAVGEAAEEAFSVAPSTVPSAVVGALGQNQPAMDGSRTALRERIAVPLDAPILLPERGTEAFANEPPSALKITADDPVVTFSVDVDTASYSVVRSSLLAGFLPPVGAVRIEEMVNYFPYAYPVPEGPRPFAPSVALLQTPWNDGTRVLQVAIQGAASSRENRPPLNLVFLIDTSGSMHDPNKLPLLKQSFRLMLGQLRPEDDVSIVTYAGSAGEVLAPTPASERAEILSALDRLEAGGSTAGQAGLVQAYDTAATMAADGEVNRVILATDGDFNIGLSDPAALEAFIARQRDAGTYLSVLGFGRGNLDDATMQALAQNGNGQAAYIDTLSEAQKVLVDQLSGALFPIANDVKIQIEFNPARIAEYRLIGYETRALAQTDFNDDRIDAGDVGAGHQVTALFEVTPVGSDAVLSDPLRYGVADASTESDELAFLRLRYKRPGEDQSELIEMPITDAATTNDEARFAAVIAGFGSLLRGVDYTGDWGFEEAIALATEVKGDDPYGYRAEAITLMRLARTLSTR